MPLPLDYSALVNIIEQDLTNQYELALQEADFHDPVVAALRESLMTVRGRIYEYHEIQTGLSQ